MYKGLLFGFLILQFSSLAQLSEVKRITQTLCSPEFHGRGYVNKGDSIASVFIADEFKQLGIKKLKGSYFQDFTLTVNTFPGRMNVAAGTQNLKPGVDFMVDPSSNGGKMNLNPKRIDYTIALDNALLIEELKSIFNKGEYNAIALDFANVPDSIKKKLKGLSQELAGMIPTIEVTNDKFTYSVSDEQFMFPLIYLKADQYREGEHYQIDIQAKQIKNYTSRNVIAYLPAKKRTKRTIVYTAHYDHLGRMGSDTYFPGANDNASGTAMLISMAAYFKKNPQDYNILFIAFAGEEAGLLGSKHFVENPTYKLKKISFLLNLDIMGSGEEGITVVNATLHENAYALLHRINAEKKLLTQIKSRGPAANSDHYWFTQMGVPAFFIYTMGPNKHYHDIFDTYEELSFQEYEDITTLLVEFGKGYFGK
jgi:aminopeptidase YwaD